MRNRIRVKQKLLFQKKETQTKDKTPKMFILAVRMSKCFYAYMFICLLILFCQS